MCSPPPSGSGPPSLCPSWYREVAAAASTLIELLAAVPSIVVGLWALLVLSPLFARHVEPFLGSLPVVGRSCSAARPTAQASSWPSVVLAVMTLAHPGVALPHGPPCGARGGQGGGYGARGHPMAGVRKVVVPAARPGIGAAVTLAMGRALGEAIAVAMVIGNSPVLPHSLIAPGATLGSAIVNQFAEAQPGLGTSSVIALAPSCWS